MTMRDLESIMMHLAIGALQCFTVLMEVGKKINFFKQLLQLLMKVLSVRIYNMNYQILLGCFLAEQVKTGSLTS